jgi:hypothetical protein
MGIGLLRAMVTNVLKTTSSGPNRLPISIPMARPGRVFLDFYTFWFDAADVHRRVADGTADVMVAVCSALRPRSSSVSSRSNSRAAAGRRAMH